MKIIKQTKEQLILRSKFHLRFRGLVFTGFPLLMILLLGSALGVESLKCQRVSSDRVDCILTKSVNFGFKQLTPQPLPLVERAEYKYTETKNQEPHHEFQLVFTDKGRKIRQTFFEVLDWQGNPDWIQNQVTKLNQFIASETGSIEIVLDHRFVPYTLFDILFLSLFIAIGLIDIFDGSLRIELHLDKSTQQLLYGQKMLWYIPIEYLSYPFTSISSVIYKIPEDSDNSFYEMKLVLNSGTKIIDIHKSSNKESVFPIAKQVAEFVGVKLKINDETAAYRHAKESAKKLLYYNKAIYSQRHEFIQVIANSNNFPNLDLDFYDQTQKLLEQQGFYKLADIEDKTSTQVFGDQYRTFMRVMVSPDRRTIASIFAFSTSSVMKKVLQAIGLLAQHKGIELESELEDKTFLNTNNLKGSTNISGDVPGIQGQLYASNTTVDQLVAAHTKTLDQLTQQKHPVYFYIYEDAIELWHRIQDCKKRHKQALGYLTPDDIRRLFSFYEDRTDEEVAWLIEEVKKEDSGDQKD